MWTGIYLNDGPTKYVKRVLGLPEEVFALNIISIGYPTARKNRKTSGIPQEFTGENGKKP